LLGTVIPPEPVQCDPTPTSNPRKRRKTEETTNELLKRQVDLLEKQTTSFDIIAKTFSEFLEVYKNK